jgi:hypothetical protein
MKSANLENYLQHGPPLPASLLLRRNVLCLRPVPPTVCLQRLLLLLPLLPLLLPFSLLFFLLLLFLFLFLPLQAGADTITPPKLLSLSKITRNVSVDKWNTDNVSGHWISSSTAFSPTFTFPLL